MKRVSRGFDSDRNSDLNNDRTAQNSSTVTADMTGYQIAVEIAEENL